MSIRVRAHAGIPVMLKAENNADGAIFVEAQATTTVANAWDTLFFDFGTPTNGVLNLSNVYDKVHVVLQLCRSNRSRRRRSILLG